MNYIRYLSPSRVPSTVSARGLLSTQRETLLQFILNFLSIGLIALIPLAFNLAQDPSMGLMSLAIVVIALIFIGLTFNRRMNFYLRAGLVVALFYAAGMVFLIRDGLIGPGILLAFLTIALSNFLFDIWIGGAIFVLTFGSVFVAGDLIVDQRLLLQAPATVENSSINLSMWGIIYAILILGGILTMLSNRVIARRLAVTLEGQERLTDQLEQNKADLERRVEERSADIRKRLSQFEVASQIARDISLEVNLQSLLDNAVRLIRDRFEFYHAGLFLSDSKGEFAVLKAATGDAGRQMLENGHHLKIGETGIVGYVVSRGEARIAGNVAEDNVHFKNPLLPETRSEIALPLKVGSLTIGALDVQSVAASAFSQEDVRILQTVADQLAIAADKARLVEALRSKVEELENTQKQSIRQTWQSHLRLARRRFNYRYKQTRPEQEAPETPQAREAIETGEPVIKIIQAQVDDQAKPVTTLAVPIKLRGQVLGVVDLQFETSSISPDLVTLIENTVDRLAISLENARLLEEIQTRAERDRLVSEITSKVRASAEVDNILRIAVQELGKSLGASEVIVQLRNA